MSINPRTLAASLHDVLAVGLAWCLAYALRFNFEVPPEFAQAMWRNLLWLLPIFALCFLRFGLYRGIWRFASIADMQHLAAATAIGALTVTAVATFLNTLMIPRSVLILHPLLLVLLMGASRMVYRSWKENQWFGFRRLHGEPVLIIGDERTADSLVREIQRSGTWYAVAVLAVQAGGEGATVHGLPVFGLDQLAILSNRFGARHAIIAMPDARPAERRRVADECAQAGLSVMTVPSYDELLSGRLSVSAIRQVELEDLLGRESVRLDDAGLHAWLAGRVVLVSGAGGSIGAELCRQIARYAPARLVLLDISEFALYAIDDELARTAPDLPRSAWAADVRDAARLAEVMAAEQPAVVFHAAAYKHVPLMETCNAWQAVRTNVLGTLTLARAAQQAGVEKFVLISTDKAVNPTNVMGATKRLAERLCTAVQSAGPTRFVTVRFGNVLGSNGSVIPRFREQIARGGPLTVTHPDIVRYFMTIPEASQLVLQAGMMGRGGEIFVLDMGEPVRIVDLARDMIRLSGLTEEEIAITFTGLRPGEKLYEELLADGEATLPTPHPKLRSARLVDHPDAAELARIETWLQPAVRPVSEVKSGLHEFVAEYSGRGEASL